jgi:integrase
MSYIAVDRRGKTTRYNVVFKDPRTGARRQKSAGSRKKDASALQRRIDAEIISGTFEKYDDIYFGEFAEKWLDESVALRLKATTISDYREIVKNHLDPFFGKYFLKNITIRTIQEYISLQTKQSISARTINKTVTALHTIFTYAVRLEYVAENPVRYAVRPRQTKQECAFLDQDEIRRFLEAASPEYYAFFATAVLTGARQGELIALRWRDVDLPRRLIHIEHSYNRLNGESDPKTKSGKRSIVISDELQRILKDHLAAVGGSHDDLVFGNRAGHHMNHQNMMTREFYPALKRAGLSRIRFHDLRHTYAAILITMGENIKFIQKQLGHASLTITMDTYGHLLPEASQDFGQRLDTFIFTDKVSESSGISRHPEQELESGDVDDVWTA